VHQRERNILPVIKSVRSISSRGYWNRNHELEYFILDAFYEYEISPVISVYKPEKLGLNYDLTDLNNQNYSYTLCELSNEHNTSPSHSALTIKAPASAKTDRRTSRESDVPVVCCRLSLQKD